MKDGTHLAINRFVSGKRSCHVAPVSPRGPLVGHRSLPLEIARPHEGNVLVVAFQALVAKKAPFLPSTWHEARVRDVPLPLVALHRVWRWISDGRVRNIGRCHAVVNHGVLG